MTFWDTVRGTRLADTLTRELPKLTKKRDKKQKIMVLDSPEEIQKKIDSGLFLEHILIFGDHFLCVFAKYDGAIL